MKRVVDIVNVGHLVAENKPGRIIGWWTFGIYQHVSGYFTYDDGSQEGFQSNSEKGCHFFDMSEYDGLDIVRFAPVEHLSRERMNAVYARCLELNGAGYDWMGLYGFLRRAKREDPNKWFCSEAWAEAWLAGQVYIQHLPVWKISPVLFFASPSLRKLGK